MKSWMVHMEIQVGNYKEHPQGQTILRNFYLVTRFRSGQGIREIKDLQFASKWYLDIAK